MSAEGAFPRGPEYTSTHIGRLKEKKDVGRTAEGEPVYGVPESIRKANAFLSDSFRSYVGIALRSGSYRLGYMSTNDDAPSDIDTVILYDSSIDKGEEDKIQKMADDSRENRIPELKEVSHPVEFFFAYDVAFLKEPARPIWAEMKEYSVPKLFEDTPTYQDHYLTFAALCSRGIGAESRGENALAQYRELARKWIQELDTDEQRVLIKRIAQYTVFFELAGLLTKSKERLGMDVSESDTPEFKEMKVERRKLWEKHIYTILRLQ